MESFDSLSFLLEGDTLIMIRVVAFPPRESFKSKVKGWSLKGMWSCPCDKACRTFPRADKLFFMAFFSAELSLSTSANDIYSDPARSIKDTFLFCRVLVILLTDSMITEKIKCERLKG
jgi:hypothetical protein